MPLPMSVYSCERKSVISLPKLSYILILMSWLESIFIYHWREKTIDLKHSPHLLQQHLLLHYSSFNEKVTTCQSPHGSNLGGLFFSSSACILTHHYGCSMESQIKAFSIHEIVSCHYSNLCWSLQIAFNIENWCVICEIASGTWYSNNNSIEA